MMLLATHNSQLTALLLADNDRKVGLIIFFIIAGVMWLFGAIGKSIQNKQQQHKFRDQRMARTQATPYQQPVQTRNQPRQKPRSNKRPPPVPVTAIVTPTASHVAPIMEGVVKRKIESETARNVRLMLTKSGAREAIVLNEILGKPKGLDT